MSSRVEPLQPAPDYHDEFKVPLHLTWILCLHLLPFLCWLLGHVLSWCPLLITTLSLFPSQSFWWREVVDRKDLGKQISLPWSLCETVCFERNVGAGWSTEGTFGENSTWNGAVGSQAAVAFPFALLLWKQDQPGGKEQAAGKCYRKQTVQFW